MWDLPGPGIEPMLSALAGGFLTTGTTGPSEKSSLSISLQWICCEAFHQWRMLEEEEGVSSWFWILHFAFSCSCFLVCVGVGVAFSDAWPSCAPVHAVSWRSGLADLAWTQWPPFWGLPHETLCATDIMPTVVSQLSLHAYPSTLACTCLGGLFSGALLMLILCISGLIPAALLQLSLSAWQPSRFLCHSTGCNHILNEVWNPASKFFLP